MSHQRLPLHDEIVTCAPQWLADGGSCVAGPNGEWLLEPASAEGRTYIVELEHSLVRQEPQSLDVAGHHARPDVTRLIVGRARRSTVSFDDPADG